MNRKLLIKSLRIFALFLGLSLIVLSFWTAHSVNIRKNLEPPLVYLNKFPESKSKGPPSFKYRVCTGLPVKLSSETVEEAYRGMSHMCVVTYKGKRLVVTDMREIMKTTVDHFKKTFLKITYGQMTNRDLMGVVYELPTPEPRFFYYRPKHFEDALIYLLRSLDRALNKTTAYKKYAHPVFNIYVWDRPTPEAPANQRVEIFSNDLALGCIGEVCLEYFQAINIL